MIGFLNGTIDVIDGSYLYIDVNGVGYKVLVSSKVLSQGVGRIKDSKIKLYTYTLVREDALELFGFMELSDLKLFEQLISISGVGPKIAINIFSKGTRDEIIRAISLSDASFFTSVPRLGKKNAQKIIIELKGKLTGDTNTEIPNITEEDNGDVVLALRSMGFSSRETLDALKRIDADGLSVEEKIKHVLRLMSK